MQLGPGSHRAPFRKSTIWRGCDRAALLKDWGIFMKEAKSSWMMKPERLDMPMPSKYSHSFTILLCSNFLQEKTILEGSSLRYHVLKEVKHSILQEGSLNSGNEQLKGFRKFLKLTRYNIPSQMYTNRQAEMPGRGSKQLTHLEETETS